MSHPERSHEPAPEIGTGAVPRSSGAGAGGTPEGSAEPPARLLVVDDEASIADVLHEFLASQGHAVTVAASGEQAVAKLAEARPDVVITDINLPGMSGLDVMREVKRLDPEVAVIVLTGHVSAASAIEALRQGAWDYVTKPFDLEDVQTIVERAVANRRLRALNRRLVEELRQKNDILQHHEHELRERVRLATMQMTTLYEVGKEISADLELAPRLQIIASKAAALTGAPAAVLYLRHEETEEARVAAVHGLPQPAAADGAPHYFRAERALGFPAFEPRPVRRSGTGDEPLALPAFPDHPCTHQLAVPMMAENVVIGALVVVDKPGGFGPDDESVLDLFASQAAIAVRNSQLYEHTKTLDRLKSEFVAVVSHEIRTPLTSVKGAVELLADERFFPLNDQQRKLLNIAHANAERLLVLINDILDFSKLESASLPMSMERHHLEPVVQQAIHNLRTLIEERRITVHVAVTPDLPPLMLDASRIAQVLTNLLSNAIKFSPREGVIEVSAQRAEGAVRVLVRDHGEGIAEPDLPKLFRKFSQIDSGSTRRVGGTGLGLVICKGIVEQHGGAIGVESTLGEGSTFWFALPETDRAAAQQAA
jgi:signal transduction histidine kinase/DNA-binding response OmpR family regulator